MLARIHATMGTPGKLEDPSLSRGQRLMIMLEGSKTLISSFLISFFASAKSFIDAMAQNSDILDNLKDLPWANYFTPDMALKIVGFLMLVIPFFHLYGKLKAALTPPQN